MRYPWSRALLAVAMVVLLSVAASAAVVCVKWDSPGPTFDGTSWETAFQKVQQGLNAATSGDEVWVAEGTYVECIILKDGVGLYGGFLGVETARDQRNFRTNETVLDANQQGSVVTSPEGSITTTVIDGFTITNGKGTGNRAGNYTGAAVHCSFSSPTISNNKITRNAGAGQVTVYCHASSALVTHNRIRSNSGKYTVYLYVASATIAGNMISGNGGAGIYSYYCYSHVPSITGNTITGNTGAGIDCWFSQAKIANNIVAHNGSGLYDRNDALMRHNNCVYGNRVPDTTSPPATGDIFADPMLMCKEYGNIHIQPLSPCRDAGWSGSQAIVECDIDGQPRIQGAGIDIGADESDGTAQPLGPYAIIRVGPGGDDADDGQTWASAKRTVQAAIDATSALGGDVWVAAGTYEERIDLHAYVYLYGGFAGSEGSRCERNRTAHQTILDGGGDGAVVRITSGHEVSVLDGFTIRDGSASGVYCDGCSPAIVNNTITQNDASEGGGIYCRGGWPIITNNLIVGNSAVRGGGIWSDARSTITSNLIIGNRSTGIGTLSGGGGIYCTGQSPVITNNTIAENTSDEVGSPGGGGMYYDHGTPQASNNIVAFNSSGMYGNASHPGLHANCVYANARYLYSGIAIADTMDNMSKDPLFVNRANGDFHLTALSPCINAGWWYGAPGLSTQDMDAQPRLMDCRVDIGADEFPFGTELANTKPAGDNAGVWLTDVIITAALDGFFYIEAPNRSVGIRVEKSAHGLTAGDMVNVTGTMGTNADGERFIEAFSVARTGSGSIDPLHISPAALGGGGWRHVASTGAGQEGVVGGLGLNNIGMYVRTWGKLTYIGGSYVLSGTGLTPSDKHVLEGLRTICRETYVRVNGVVSCYRAADGLHPIIIATEIQPL